MRKGLILASVLAVAVAAWAAGEEARKMGTVKVTTPGMVLKVKVPSAKADGKAEEVPLPPLKEVPLPEGAYEVASVQLFGQGVWKGKREVWCLETTEEIGKLRNFAVADGGKTTLEGGAPLTLKVTTRIEDEDDRDRPVSRERGVKAHKVVRVLFVYVGKSGEQYDPRIKKGKNPGPNPVVRVLDPEGKVLDEGTYSYPVRDISSHANVVGGYAGQYVNPGKREGYTWTIPAGFKGKVQVEVLPIGPFEVKKPEKPVTVEIRDSHLFSPFPSSAAPPVATAGVGPGRAPVC